jgi:hypothetical protein
LRLGLPVAKIEGTVLMPLLMQITGYRIYNQIFPFAEMLIGGQAEMPTG